jgi:serine/threonine protein kinase
MAQAMIADRYILQVPLGRGAFGQVWRAEDTTLGRQVAVKVVDLTAINNAPQLADIVARFKREALAVGGLRHRNIVSAFDAGQAGSTLYLVMELVAGNSLAKLIEDRRDRELGPMPIAEVLDIATQVCAGLSSAHATGVVHRDIKPGNVMVDPDQQVKIIDFGIARFVHDDLPRLTVPGAGVGTLSYVAPEQAQGLEVDGRADLYSLGCMLYEMLAGERPFVAAVPAALLNKQLSEQAAPLRARRPDVPASLAALVTQLMEKDPADRPAGAQEVSDRLSAIAESMHMHGSGQPGSLGAGSLETSGSVTRSAQARDPIGVEAARATVRADSPVGAASGRVGSAEELAGFQGKVDSAVPVGPVGAGSSAGTSGSATRPAGWGGPDSDPRVRRPRGRWAIVSAFLLLAVVGAAVTFVLLRPHGALAVTAVAVAPASPPRPGQCDVTVNVIGTIVTNGRSGAVMYQWTRSDGTTSPVQTATIASGRLSEQVHLYWTIRGRGTIHASARLRVLSPSVQAASTSFVYSCR